MTKLGKMLALTLACILLLGSCSMISVDREMDNNEVVAEVGDEKILKGEAMEIYNYYADVYASFYGASGEEFEQQLKQDILDLLVQDAVLRAKAEELGLTTLTEEEQAQAQEDADTEYNDTLESLTESFKTDDNTEEEARQEALDYMESEGYGEEQALDNATSQIVQDKLRASVTDSVTVSEEDLQTAYDDLVAQQQASYDSDVSQYEYDVMNNELIAYVPEGFRAVKHILIKFTDEQISALSDLDTQLQDVEYVISTKETEQEEAEATAEAEESAAPEETAEATEEPVIESDGAADEATAEPEATEEAEATAEPEATVEPEATAEAEATAESEASAEPEATAEPEEEVDLDTLSLDELYAKKAELEQQIADTKAEYVATIQDKVDEVGEKIAAGEDFDSLIETYGEDEGMQEEPFKTNGYYVSAESTMWDQSFTDGAMALSQVGDVSGPVVGINGVHFIKYVADVTPGEVGLDAIRTELEQTTLESLQEEAYNSAVEQWVEEADAKTYVDRMVEYDNLTTPEPEAE